MKKLLLLSVVLLVSTEIFCQDLIITMYGDPINCEITEIRNRTIYFLVKSDDGLKGLSLPLDKIKRFEYDYYKLPKQAKTKKQVSNKDKDSLDKREPVMIMLSADAGLSFTIGRLAESIPDDLRDYYHQLRSGFNLTAGVSLWLDEELGIGFKYQNFLSKNELNSDLEVKYGKMTDNLKITLYAPSVNLRFDYGNGTAFYNNYYLGYMSYKNQAIALSNPATLTGGTLGVGIDGGYEVDLGEHFIVAFQGSLLAGVLKKVRVDNGITVRTLTLEKDNYESLYRVDFSIGLRFR